MEEAELPGIDVDMDLPAHRERNVGRCRNHALFPGGEDEVDLGP